MATIWQLISERAASTPDAVMLIAEDDSRITFGEFEQRAARLAAGLAGLGIGSETRVTWQLPSRIDTVVASAALARLDAVQYPILHLYREKEVGFVLRHTAAEFCLVPGVWNGFDYVAMAEGLAAQIDPAPRVLRLDELPEGDPATLPPAPSTRMATSRSAGSTHLGHDVGPQGRAAHRRDADRRRPGPGRRARHDADDVGSIAFPFAHIAGPDYLVMMLIVGLSAVIVEAFAPAAAVECYRRNGVTMVGRGTAFYQMFLAEQRKRSRASRSSRRCARCPAAGRRCRPRSTTRSATRWASRSATATA